MIGPDRGSTPPELGKAASRHTATACKFGIAASPARNQQLHGHPGVLGAGQPATMPSVRLDRTSQKLDFREVGGQHQGRDHISASEHVSRHSMLTVDQPQVSCKGHRR